MTEEKKDLAALLGMQMESIPMRADGVRTTNATPERTDLSIPLEHGRFARLLRRVLPLSDEKNVELDRLGSEIYALCDGTRTIEDLVEMHQRNWNLSFFEARAMILNFLKLLSQRNLVFFLTPDEKPESHADEKPLA